MLNASVPVVSNMLALIMLCEVPNVEFKTVPTVDQFSGEVLPARNLVRAILIASRLESR